MAMSGNLKYCNNVHFWGSRFPKKSKSALLKLSAVVLPFVLHSYCRIMNPQLYSHCGHTFTSMTSFSLLISSRTSRASCLLGSTITHHPNALEDLQDSLNPFVLPLQKISGQVESPIMTRACFFQSSESLSYYFFLLRESVADTYSNNNHAGSLADIH